MVWPAIIAAGASLLGNMMSNSGDDGAGAQALLQQAHQMGKDTFDPYINRGHAAQDRASGQYNRMSENPMDFLNQITEGYSPSEGYRFREKHALNAARNSAAAGGISGTYNDQLGQADLVNGLLGQDMQQWLQNVLGVQGMGLQGLENEAGRGFGASQSLADLLGNIAGSQAGLSYNRDQASSNSLGNIIGGIGGLAGSLAGAFGGGGGGIGGAIGSGLGSMLGGARGGGSRSGGMSGNWAGNIGGGLTGGALGSFRPSVYGGGRG